MVGLVLDLHINSKYSFLSPEQFEKMDIAPLHFKQSSREIKSDIY